MPNELVEEDFPESEWDGIRKTYQPRILRFVISKLGDHDHSHNVTHDVFDRVSRSAEFLKLSETQREKFLRRTARNLIANFLRYQTQKCRDSRRNIAGDALSELKATGPGPSTALDQSQKIQDVREAIGKLPTELRTVIHLRFFDPSKPSSSKIAKILGIRVRTYFRRLDEARQRLSNDPTFGK